MTKKVQKVWRRKFSWKRKFKTNSWARKNLWAGEKTQRCQVRARYIKKSNRYFFQERSM